ncbi:MAG: hypothetical protein OEW05_03770 [Candidatus Aminicenantes bacterium]|nr:hypothetical protein [Candidatus Aminicenantes bacterium]
MKTLRSFLRLAVVVGLLAATANVPAQVVDCVAAVVAGRPVTLFDIRIAESFGLYAEEVADKSGSPRLLILEEIINQKAVLDLAREQVGPGPDEVAAAMAGLASRLGPDAVGRALADLGLTEADLRSVVAERVQYREVLALRFSQPPAVSLREIEAYYQETFVPERQKQGATPEPMIDVLDRLEARIRDEKRAAQVAAWIRDVRRQTAVELRPDCLK